MEGIQLDKGYTLVDIMECLICHSKIYPQDINGQRCYRCSGYNQKICKSSTISASKLENIVKDIVIENIDKIFIFKFNNEYNSIRENLKRLREEKLKFLKEFSDGILSNNDAEILRDVQTKILLQEDNKSNFFRKINSHHSSQIINQEKDYIKELLNSDKYSEINLYYKSMIDIEINLLESYGIVKFQSPDRDQFPEDMLPTMLPLCYKFSWTPHKGRKRNT